MPAISSTFKSSEPPLADILKEIHSGKIQLPDFQRSWVWDDDHIRSLIASVSQSYPIGAVMTLQTGGDGVQFQPRAIESVLLPPNTRPEILILDGQQRMTSLYLALFSAKPVPIKTDKGDEISRVYYLDIKKCLSPEEERLEAVLSFPADKKITSDFGRKVEVDLNTVEHEYQRFCFPLEIIFDSTKYAAWRRGFQKVFRNDERALDLFDCFESEVIGRFQSYRVPIIELLKDTPKEAVCQVFEKVNTGGVTLTVFELVTAIYAADNFNLRNDWEARQKKLNEHAVVAGVDATTFLTTVTLMASYQNHLNNPNSGITCKKRDVLKLTLSDYKNYSDKVVEGMKMAARFLAREKVFDKKMLPYGTQLVPLAAICAWLGERFEDDAVRRKLSQWYWAGVFGELYGGANETRFAFDLPDVVAWIDGGEIPRTLRDASFNPIRLLSMQTRLSAAYKGLMALLMKAGSHDVMSGDSIEISTYFDLAIDIHHIFPRSYCEKKKYNRQKWNSSVNKAPLSSKTNRTIGGSAPSEYLTSIQKNSDISETRLNEIIISHQIDPMLLRTDNFEEFIRDRASKLLILIENAMGKSISGRDSEEVIEEYGAALIFAK